MDKKNSVLLGVALTTLIVAASSCKSAPNATGSLAEGECHGINSCKGKGDCGGPGYSCAGNNSCKGQGWIKLTKADCDTKGGKFKSS